jgi:hypothetical protein
MSHEPGNCLSHIIGLSRSTCSCFDSSKPLDAVTSDSGLYLDELEGLRLNMVNAINDCEAGGMWDILSKAFDNSKIALKSDLMVMLLENNLKQRREPFTGSIGSAEFKNSLSVASYSYAGARIYCANIISGVMKIKRIGLVFDAAGTFSLSVYNNYSNTPINTYTVTTTAAGLTWVTLPTTLELEMNNEYEDNPQYYILYQSSAAPNPKDIKASCGCSSKHYQYYFNTSSPVFKSYEKYRWSEYIMLAGTKGNSLSDRKDWSTEQYLNGIMLDAEFNCITSDLICKQNLNYESNPLALAMAYAIRYRSGAYVIDNILASSQINRFTMMDRETMSGKRNNFLKEYRDRVSWIAKEMNWKANDCLMCNDFDDVLKIGIFA